MSITVQDRIENLQQIQQQLVNEQFQITQQIKQAKTQLSPLELRLEALSLDLTRVSGALEMANAIAAQEIEEAEAVVASPEDSAEEVSN